MVKRTNWIKFVRRNHRNNDEIEQIPRVLDVASYTVANDLQNALNKKQNAKHNV